MKKNYYLVLFIIFWFIISILIPAKDSYVADGLVKYIQAKSLALNHYSSEEILNPSKNLDPENNFFIFKKNCKIRKSQLFSNIIELF